MLCVDIRNPDTLVLTIKMVEDQNIITEFTTVQLKNKIILHYNITFKN